MPSSWPQPAKIRRVFSLASRVAWFSTKFNAPPSYSWRSRPTSTGSAALAASCSRVRRTSSPPEARRLTGRPDGGPKPPAIFGTRDGRQGRERPRCAICRFRAPRPRRHGLPDIVARLLRGGYPPAVERADPDRRRAWFGSYILTVLERDIRDMARIEGLTALPRVLALIAARTAGLANFAEVARSLAMPQTTLKRYFALLGKAAFLIELLPAWSTNLGKRLIKAPKLFLNDTGLAAYLLGVNESRLERETPLRGALLENFVAMELRKQASWSRVCAQVFHFRTAAGQEVDFVVEDGAGKIVGIEVKASATVTSHDFNGLRALSEVAGPRFHRGIVLHTGDAVSLSVPTCRRYQ